MIIKEETMDSNLSLDIKFGSYDLCSNAVYFDLEHYVYRKPKCIGVFGAGTCFKDKIKVTQYMIEKNADIKELLIWGKEYFKKCEREGKKYIITFSGNNDFLVINYLFDRYHINYNILDKFLHIDIQKEYERVYKTSIGLKALEKDFDIIRESELISGSTLSKTFSHLIKDDSYIERIPKEKVNKILLYNKQDVLSLYTMCKNWNKYIKVDFKGDRTV